MHALATRHGELLDQFSGNYRHLLDETLHTLDQKILWPLKNARDEIRELRQESPEEIKFFWQGKIVRPLHRLAQSALVEAYKLRLDAQAVVPRWSRYMKKLFNDVRAMITDKIYVAKDKGPSDSGIGQDMTGAYA